MTKITALPDPRGDVTEWLVAGNHRKDGYYFTSAEYAKGRAISSD